MQYAKFSFRLVLVLLLASVLIPSTGSLAQTPECTPDAAFVADVSIPDDTEFAPGTDFVKTWTLRNSGTCDWTEQYRLAWSRGDKLTDDLVHPLGRLVKPGETVDVSVPMTAPTAPGTYSSNWEMQDKTGRPFGLEVYVRIVVTTAEASSSPTPVMVMPGFTATLTSTFSPIPPLGGPMPQSTPRPSWPIRASGRVVHYDLFITDGYVNSSRGVWPPDNDPAVLPGWTAPLYIWGVTDVDPDAAANRMTVPAGAGATKGTEVGNGRYPAPFLEAGRGDDVYVTVHNRGFRQEKQLAQPDQALRLIGVHTAAQYAGFPEAAGGYTETLRSFWQEPWYLAFGADTKTRDARWNSLPIPEQQALLDANSPLKKVNALSPVGGIRSMLNRAHWPIGIGSLPAGTSIEDATQFTYYFRAGQPGTYLYRTQSAGAGRLTLGAPGALIVRPSDFGPTNTTVYGANTGSGYDLEYTFLLSEVDPILNALIESGQTPNGATPARTSSLWLINGRPFPQTLNPFAWNGSEREPRYDTAIKVEPDQTFLVRYLNAGAEAHTLRQAGWLARLIGANGEPLADPGDVTTWSIAPGETVDTLTTAIEPPAPAPLSSRRAWPQVWFLGEEDGERVTTAGIYPGGMLTLIQTIRPEATKAVTATLEAPTWWNPYLPTPQTAPIP